MNLIELLGIIQNSEALNTVGTFLRWYEILTLAVIVFAILEFMERTRLRTYIFKWGNLSRTVFKLIIFAISTVIVANLLPLFNRYLPIRPLLSYPAFWEMVGIIAFSIALILMIIFSLFQFRFIPKIERKNCDKLFNNIHRIILNDRRIESLSAISIIIDKNLETIIEHAAKYDKNWNIKVSPFKTPFEKNEVPKEDYNLVQASCQLIDVAMSDKSYCRYLSENNIGLLLRIIDKTNKHKLWDSCGFIFFDSLCKELFLNDQSHLSREMEFRGPGLHKPVFKALFTSLSILSLYTPFQSVPTLREENYKIGIISKYIMALEVALEEYFKDENYIYFLGNPNIALSLALKDLSNILLFICIRIRKCNNDEIYYNKYEDVIRAIERFYHNSNLKKCLFGIKEFVPHFSQEDLRVKEHSLTRGIIEAIFEYLDALTILEHEDYARMLSTAVFWLIFPGTDERPKVIQNMEEELLNLLKKRVEENKKGGYSSMIKLLINIYGGFRFHEGVREHVKIGKYIEEEFKKNLALDILTDKEKEKRYLPKNYTVNRKLKTIKDLHGKVIYKAK